MVEQGYNEDGELAEISEKTKRPEPEVSIVHEKVFYSLLLRICFTSKLGV